MKAFIDWSQIDTVLLDMDGTLLDLHFDWHFWMEYLPQAYANKNGLDLQEANEIIHTKVHSQKGTLNWYCLDYWTAELDLPVAELKHELKHMIKEHPDVIEFLAKLRSMNKKVIMVTNAHRDSLALKLEMTEIGDHFDHLISAHDFGLPKEDIRIWTAIQEIEAYNPKRTLLIDDNLLALKTAKAYGIEHLLCAVHVSPNMKKVNPQYFNFFEHFRQIMPS